VEEDDGGEILWPGFTSQCCRQGLGAGGARCRRGTPFGLVGLLGAARQ
jgi:hypothetical protein